MCCRRLVGVNWSLGLRKFDRPVEISGTGSAENQLVPRLNRALSRPCTKRAVDPSQNAGCEIGIIGSRRKVNILKMGWSNWDFIKMHKIRYLASAHFKIGPFQNPSVKNDKYRRMQHFNHWGCNILWEDMDANFCLMRYRNILYPDLKFSRSLDKNLKESLYPELHTL